jgi:hypothetical protein
MKRLFALSLVATGLVLLSGCIVVVDDASLNRCPSLAGYTLTDARFEPPYWGVEVFDDIQVVVVPANYYQIEVTADAGALPYVRTQTADDGVLEIWYDGPACARVGVVEVYVTGPDLTLFGSHPETRPATPDSMSVRTPSSVPSTQ